MSKSKFQNKELNPEICEFIGAFIGDGYLGNYGLKKNQYVLGLAGDKKLDEDYFNNYLKPLIKRNFPFTRPKIYYRRDENTIMFRINSKELYGFFINLSFKNGKKSRNIRIPEEIVKINDFMDSTIRGIFDTDGCIFMDKRKSYNKPYPRITLQSSSLNLINQLERCL